MDDLYRDYILDHYKNPRNYGELPEATNRFSDSNPLCGDELTFALKVAGDRIEDVRFTGKGCAISQASASMLSEQVKGRTLDEVKKLGQKDVLENLGIAISPARIKCAMLSLKTLKSSAWGLTSWSEAEAGERK